jgi:hypothetical protein
MSKSDGFTFLIAVEANGVATDDDEVVGVVSGTLLFRLRTACLTRSRNRSRSRWRERRRSYAVAKARRSIADANVARHSLSAALLLRALH